MIKKTTKVIFDDGESKREEDLIGGIPLSKGEIISVHGKNGKITKYQVKEKKIDCFLDGENQIIDIVYVLRKRN